MKRLITLTFASLFATALTTSLAFALQEKTDYPTRTLNAEHALTTGSPHYADLDMGRKNKVKVDATNEFDAREKMEEIQEEERINRVDEVPADQLEDDDLNL